MSFTGSAQRISSKKYLFPQQVSELGSWLNDIFTLIQLKNTFGCFTNSVMCAIELLWLDDVHSAKKNSTKSDGKREKKVRFLLNRPFLFPNGTKSIGGSITIPCFDFDSNKTHWIRCSPAIKKDNFFFLMLRENKIHKKATF